MKQSFFPLLALLLLLGFLPANPCWSAGDVHAFAQLVANVKQVKPGEPFKLGVYVKLEPEWHSYYKIPGDAGMPTRVEWVLPKGFTAGELEWQKPEKFNEQGIVTYGYEKEYLVGATIKPPKDLQVGGSLPVKANVKWLTCKDVCVPGQTDVALTLPVAAKAEPASQEDVARFMTLGFNGPVEKLGGAPEMGPTVIPDLPKSGGLSILDETLNVEGAGAGGSILAYLGMAFIGGVILNAMPCVLPVIAIKILSFVEQAKDEPKKVRMSGLAFSAGIVASFMLLAALFIGLKAAGQSIGWGFQFQYPGFLIGMSVVVLLFALSLFGLFYVSFSPGQAQIDQLASKEGMTGTFFKGVLATVLSTPCTAPFLSPALGFALVQPWYVVVGIFLMIAVGMSMPYLLLTANPQWMRFMPKPGLWMEKLKESFGFVLLATVIWLLAVLGDQVGITGVVFTSFFLLAVAFATWLVSRYTDLTSTQVQRARVWALALLLIGLAFYVCIAKRPELSGVFSGPAKVTQVGPTELEGGIAWEPFSIAALDKHLNAGDTVFLDFTAQWCLTCKVNEQTVLSTEKVTEKFKALHVVTMKADWTKQDPQITSLLKKFNRSGVPLYVIFPAHRPTQPIIVPEPVTQEIVLEKLDQATRIDKAQAN